MVYKIVLSERAIKDIDQTVAYLLKKWTVKEALSYLDTLEKLKVIISKNPALFRFYDVSKGIQKAVLAKHNIVFYKVDRQNNSVQVITIFNVFQVPDKIDL